MNVANCLGSAWIENSQADFSISIGQSITRMQPHLINRSCQAHTFLAQRCVPEYQRPPKCCGAGLWHGLESKLKMFCLCVKAFRRSTLALNNFRDSFTLHMRRTSLKSEASRPKNKSIGHRRERSTTLVFEPNLLAW